MTLTVHSVGGSSWGQVPYVVVNAWVESEFLQRRDATGQNQTETYSSTPPPPTRGLESLREGVEAW